jgi:dinuclear metal center YbgI/SA1388 family protein
MEKLAPLKLAQSWDNVGLLAGELRALVRRVLLTIDLTALVVQEAIEKRADVVLAYHPPIFKPVSRLVASGGGMDTLVHRCIRAGIALYSPHTALDAADGGTNDVLAGLCGLRETEPVEHVDDPRGEECKFVVFVPPKEVEKVAQAVFNAGGGRIGDYQQCSFRIPGEGTFFGGASTQPTIGERGRREHVEEIRLEVVVPTRRLPEVIAAMRKAHSYEEPAFDIYPNKPRPVRGIGRHGRFPKPLTLSVLARKLRAASRAANVQLVGDPAHRIEQAVIVAGAAGGIPFRVPLTPRHVVVTGEIRHHDALAYIRAGCSAIALGHWASERPVLPSLAARLNKMLGVTTLVSAADDDPFRAL